MADDDKLSILNDYYEVPKSLPTLIDPVYIHSHDRALRAAIQRTNSFIGNIKKTITDIHETYGIIKGGLENAIKDFQQVQDKLVAAGYPTDKDRPYGLTETFKEINRRILKAREVIIFGKKTVGFNRNHLTHTEIQNFLDAVEKEAIKTTTDNAIETVQSYFNNQKQIHPTLVSWFLTKLQRTVGNTKGGHKNNKSFKDLSQEELNKLTFSGLKDYLGSRLNNKQDFIKKLEGAVRITRSAKSAQEEFDLLIFELKQYVPILQELDKQPKDRIITDSKVLSTLKMLTSKKELSYKLGYLEELVSACMDLESIEQFNKVQYRDKDSGKVIFTTEHDILGTKPKVYQGDNITTDIRVHFKNQLDELEGIFGVSVKLNPRYFRKDVDADTTNYPVYPEFEDVRMQYYLLNYQALSLVCFPQKDKKIYKKAAKGKRPSVQPAFRSKDVFNVISEFEQSLLIEVFIKGVIGSFFSGFNERDSDMNNLAEEAQGFPILIQTSVGQYWTSDILRKVLKIIEDYNTNPLAVKQFMEQFTPYQAYGSRDINKGDNLTILKELLIDLYMAKAKNYYTTSEAYKFRKNRIKKLSYDSRYDELYADKEVANILNEIGKINNIGQLANVKKLLTKKWKIKFDFSTFYFKEVRNDK